MPRHPHETVTVQVNGRPVAVPAGSMASAAVALAGETAMRRSVSGQPRAALCGMGVCFECRVTIDGRAHQRSCQTVCREGMEVQTDGP
jgi:predicted molibdopterin-dependent oxidoreductase YjgC